MGQGKLWLPARASKHLPSQHSLSALFLPAGSAGLDTLRVVGVSAAGGEASLETRRCRTAARATQDSAPRYSGTSTAGKPAYVWVELGPNCMANEI